MKLAHGGDHVALRWFHPPDFRQGLKRKASRISRAPIVCPLARRHGICLLRLDRCTTDPLEDLRRVEMKIRVMIGRAGMARVACRASRVPDIFDEVDLRAAPMRIRDALQRMEVEMMRLCVLAAPHRYEPETCRLAYPAK